MKLRGLVEKFGLEVKCAASELDREIKSGYVSDLLSDVIARGRAGDLWVTLQIHRNIVGVASLKNLAAIVIVNGRQPEEETIKKAENEGIPLMVSKLPAFELVGRLYGAGISGTR